MEYYICLLEGSFFCSFKFLDIKSCVIFICLIVVALLECMQLQISYTSENVVEGKSAAKKALQQKLGLKQADLPLIGIITRLTHQKGIHLIKHAIWRTLERNGQVFFS